MGYVTELPAHTRVLYEMILFSGVLNLSLDFNSTDFDNRLLSTCQGPGPELCAGATETRRRSGAHGGRSLAGDRDGRRGSLWASRRG